MIRPFKGTFLITQEWGVNPADYARFGLKGHNGVDYGTPTGTHILAPHSGRVIEAAYDQYGYGNYVKIENDKEGSILAHLQSFNVNAGDTISEGQQIGISNNTGNSTGPHLHWGYYRMPRNKSDGFSGTTNPFPYLQENNQTIPPGDDCPTKLKQVTEERDRLNGVITGKDKQIDDLKDQIEALTNTNNDLSKTNLSLIKDIESVKEHDKLTLDAALSKQRTDLLVDFASEKKALQSSYDEKLKEASKEQITIVKEVETPLDKRFKGKTTKVKLQAITTIVLA